MVAKLNTALPHVPANAHPAGAIWSFVHPYDAFWSLAAVLGFLLILKGTLDIVESVTSQAISNIWWLGLVSGILEVGLGFWASQQFYPARGALLLLWVGFYAAISLGWMSL